MAKKKLIPQKLKILVTIVNRSKGNLFCDLIEGLGVNMQMVVNGEGSVPSNLNNLWGLSHKDRAVIFSFVPEDKVKKVLKLLDSKFETVRNGDGVAFCIPISSIIGVAVYQFLVDSKRKKEIKK